MNHAIRLVALFEALKGLLVLLVGSGLAALLHKDLYAIALQLVEHAHLNPASHYPRIFLDAASNLHNALLALLALGAMAYAALRFIEAWGLYFHRAWAELLAACSGAIYLPFELMALVRNPTPLSASLLLINAVIVSIMLAALHRRQRFA